MNNYEKITGFADEISDELTVQIGSLRKLGIRHVEMRGVDGKNLIHHDDTKVREIKERLDDAGITLSALGSPLGKIAIDDPFEPHFEEFKRACEIAHRMETRYIRMFSFYVSGEERLIRKDEVLERLGKFADYAAGADVVLLHENEKGIYGESAQECLELMKAFSDDHFKAIFDFANFVQCGQDTLKAYELLKDYIVYIHVKDARKENGVVVPVGYGDGNVETILGKLFADGFDGFLSLEPHLFNFKGFAGLERGRAAILAEDGTSLNGFEAFSTAYDALKEILKTI